MTDVGAKTWDSARCGVVGGGGGGGGGGDGGDVATCSFSTLAGNPCCSPLHHSGCQHPNIRRQCGQCEERKSPRLDTSSVTHRLSFPLSPPC